METNKIIKIHSENGKIVYYLTPDMYFLKETELSGYTYRYVVLNNPVMECILVSEKEFKKALDYKTECCGGIYE